MQQERSPTLTKVIRMFKRYDCDEQTLLTKYKLTQILNKQATINLHHNFSPSIIQEIWGQTQTTSRGESTVLIFAKIFSQAIAILQDRISIIDGPTGMMQKQAQLKVEQNKLKDLELQYQKGFEQGYDNNNIARKNIAIIEDKIKQLRRNKSEFERDLEEMMGCLEVEERPPTIERSQYIAQSRLQESTSPPAPSPHLSLIFKVTVIATVLQMLLLNFHESFLALLCYFLILYWLFLGYYDQYFVKALILGLALSCVLDIVSVCLEIMGKLGTNRFYSKEKAWVVVSIVFIIIQVTLRVLLLIKLCLFRDPSAKKEYFVLFDHQIELNARSGKILASQQRD